MRSQHGFDNSTTLLNIFTKNTNFRYCKYDERILKDDDRKAKEQGQNLFQIGEQWSFFKDAVRMLKPKKSKKKKRRTLFYWSMLF